MTCQYLVVDCSKEATERVSASPTAQIQGMQALLCHEHSSRWCAILEHNHRDFDRVSLATGESQKFISEGFQRTSRVGRGVSRR